LETPICYIPIEGSFNKIVHRWAAMRTGISMTEVQHRGWDFPDQEGEYQGQLELVLENPYLFGPASPQATPRRADALDTFITVQARQNGIQVFYVDHMEKLAWPEERNEGATHAIDRWLTRLAETAAREQVALVMQSQVTPNIKHPAIPDMGMLRWSRGKEQASQIVLMAGLGMEQVDGDRRKIQMAYRHDAEGRVLRTGTPMYLNLEKFTEGATGLISSVKYPSLFIDDRSGAVEEIG